MDNRDSSGGGRTRPVRDLPLDAPSPWPGGPRSVRELPVIAPRWWGSQWTGPESNRPYDHPSYQRYTPGVLPQTNHFSGTVLAHSGSSSAFCGGNSGDVSQHRADDWPRVSVVIARTPEPTNIFE